MASGWAVIDWYAAYRSDTRIEKVAKPLVLLLLIAAALATDPFDSTVKTLFVIGLVFSLIGDVILMLDDAPFIAGLGSFLIAHIFYIVGMAQVDLSLSAMLIALAALAAPLALIGPRLLRSVAAKGIPALTIGVIVYVIVISTMVVVAVATTQWLVITAALMFYLSDALLGWNRFVEPIKHGKFFVHCTYHIAQIGFVAWLATGSLS
jgi:uncharacterized membrane protein YhhN